MPGWHLATWSAIGVSSAAAIVTGAVRNKARPRTPWLLLAAGVLFFCLGDTTYNILTDVLGQANPFPSPADLLYLAMYPLVAAGLFQIVRARTSGPDHGEVLDALILTAGLVLLSWIFLINPYLNDDHL